MDGPLATDRRRHLHCVRAVLPGRHLGHADRAGQAMTAAAAQAGEVILRTRGVGKTFGKFVALNNISAEFSRGAITSIIGPNGAGKSTYFNLLCGAFPPTNGRVEFEGRDVTGLPQHRFAAYGHRKVVPDHQRVSATLDAREHPRRFAGHGVAIRHLAASRASDRTGRTGRRTAGPGRTVEGLGSAPPRRWRMASSGRWRSAWRSRANPACCCWTSRPPA